MHFFPFLLSFPQKLVRTKQAMMFRFDRKHDDTIAEQSYLTFNCSSKAQMIEHVA